MIDPYGGKPAEPAITSPAAERNAGPILAVLRRVLPAEGVVLEVASGGGQHAVTFAKALPGLQWQPSDPSPEACASIRARCRAADLVNLRQPLALDARARAWPVKSAAALLAVNLLHIAPWEVTAALFAGAAAILPAGAPVVVYGPFLSDGEHTAASNAAFDADLRRRDPSWGIRERKAVVEVARANGIELAETVEMPANNLTLVLRKRS